MSPSNDSHTHNVIGTLRDTAYDFSIISGNVDLMVRYQVCPILTTLAEVDV